MALDLLPVFWCSVWIPSCHSPMFSDGCALEWELSVIISGNYLASGNYLYQRLFWASAAQGTAWYQTEGCAWAALTGFLLYFQGSSSSSQHERWSELHLQLCHHLQHALCKFWLLECFCGMLGFNTRCVFHQQQGCQAGFEGCAPPLKVFENVARGQFITWPIPWAFSEHLKLQVCGGTESRAGLAVPWRCLYPPGHCPGNKEQLCCLPDLGWSLCSNSSSCD